MSSPARPARSNFNGAEAGDTVHPAGTCIVAVAFTAPFVLLVTVTTTERARAFDAGAVATADGRRSTSSFVCFSSVRRSIHAIPEQPRSTGVI